MGTFDMDTFLNVKDQYMSGQGKKNVQQQIANAGQDWEAMNQQKALQASQAQQQAMSGDVGAGDPSVQSPMGAAISRRMQSNFAKGSGDLQRTMQVTAPMQRMQRMTQAAQAGMSQEQQDFKAMVNQQKYDLYQQERQNNIFGQIFGAIGSVFGFGAKLLGL